MKKKTYKVTYKYEGQVTVIVEAKSEDHARSIGIGEADEMIGHNLSVVYWTARETNDNP